MVSVGDQVERGPGAFREAVVTPQWRPFYEETKIPAAVRAGRTLYVTGHDGEGPDGLVPDDVETQLRNTFRNIEVSLRAAGAAWSDVVELTSYHVGLRDQAELLLAVAAEFLSDPFPAWTAVGVTELFDEGAVFEMSCVAVLREA